MTDSPEMIVLFNNSHFGLASCGKESQSSPRWRAFSFGCASAEGEGALKGRAVGHRPSLGQDELGVSSVFDFYRTGHSRKQNYKGALPGRSKHFEFPCLTGAMNANCAHVVPCFSMKFLRGGRRERDHTSHGRTRRARSSDLRHRDQHALCRWRETAEAGGDPLPVTGAIDLWTPSKSGWAA